MAFFVINEPNQEPKYIKSVDGASGKIEFTTNQSEAYYKDSGFFADSEFEFIKFHFKDKYPELQYMSIDNGWGHSFTGDVVGGIGLMDVAEAMEEVGDAVGAA